MSKQNKNDKEVLLDSQEVEVVEEKQPKQEKPAKKEKAKKDKKPREHKLGRKVKETTSELKKVSWPSFGQVCKRTGIVLAFVVLATAILFGIDSLLGWLHKLLIDLIV